VRAAGEAGVAGDASPKPNPTPNPNPNQERQRPRRLTFVMDVSGSMYRFNGYDGRLKQGA